MAQAPIAAGPLESSVREQFEQWYLRVVRGHPSNLARDASGGYLYLGAMYLAWEAATLIEREACAKVCDERAETWAKGESPASWQQECARFIRMRSNLEVRGTCADLCASSPAP